jgi:putative peptidoglycan lipid II flippase
MSGSSPKSMRKLTISLMQGAFASKILGFLREIFMAQTLGVSVVADSFRASLTAILLPLSLLQGDVVPAVLIPLLRQWQDEDRAVQRFSTLTIMLLMVSFVITGCVAVFADQWVRLLVGGFSPDGLAETERFIHVMALAMPPLVLINCLASMEVSLNRSRIAALRASVQNAGVILGIAIMVFTGKPIAIAWGFTSAYVVSALWGAWTLGREGQFTLVGLRFSEGGQLLLSFLRRLRVMIAQPIAEQAQIWVERSMISGTASGLLAALDYARTLTTTTVYLISGPVGLAMIAHSGGMNQQAMRRRVEGLSRPMLILLMPASVFLMQFSPDIVDLMFARGEFGAKGTALTSGSMIGISAGLWAVTLGMIMIRILNGERRNGSAAIVVVQAFFLNMLFNLWLSPRMGAVGFGLGEAVRGIAMLTGASLALRCGWTVLRLVLQMLPWCASLWLLSIWAHSEKVMLIQLGLGVIAYLCVVSCAALVMMRPSCLQLLREIRNRWKGKRTA